MDLSRDFEKLETKRAEIEEEVSNIKTKTIKFSNWAWFLVFLGMIPFAIGILLFFLSECQITTLSELGDFLSGTSASIWSLAGLLFIYVAFLGQRQQLLNQELEILYNRFELKATRLELEMTRKEHEKSALAQMESSDALKQQVKNMQFGSKIGALEKLISIYSSKISKLENKVKSHANRAAVNAWKSRLNEVENKLMSMTKKIIEN